MKISQFEPTYHQCLQIEIEELNLPEPLVVRFISSSRNDTSFNFEYEPTQDIEEIRMTYGVMGGLDKKASHLIDQTLQRCGIHLNCQIDAITKCARLCVNKCESRYGNNVADFELFQADAILVLS